MLASNPIKETHIHPSPIMGSIHTRQLVSPWLWLPFIVPLEWLSAWCKRSNMWSALFKTISLSLNSCNFTSMNGLFFFSLCRNIFHSAQERSQKAKRVKKSPMNEVKGWSSPDSFCPRTNTLPFRLSFDLDSDPDRPRLNMDFHFLDLVDNFLLDKKSDKGFRNP